METLVTIGYSALCIFFVSLAVAIHEFGHFIVALKLGLRVSRFSIGFGPAIWKKTWCGVEYRISWIPLGGYVMLPDMDPEGTKKLQGGTDADAAARTLPPWKEIAVAVAGPGMNIVLAVVLACLLAVVPSVRFGEVPAEITSVVPGGPAERAGVRAGDTVVSVGGKRVGSWSEMQVEFQIAGATETEVAVRGASGEMRSVRLTPELDPVTGAYFIQAVHVSKEDRAANWMPARSPLKQLAWDAGSIFRVLKGLVTPREAKNAARALGGPQTIFEGIYRSVRRDFWDGLGFMRFLNVNLAVLNLLPIPVLDGGIILFALLALVFRRRVPEKVVTALSTGFMVLILLATGVLIFRDAHRSWRIHRYEATQNSGESPAPDAAGGGEANSNNATNETTDASN
ncbi:MAG: site-2 protease family protein [Kiritimatiellae bacterium]|nr:site-2 protease family protein [Kiritimatiellia bacterium]